MFDSSHQLLDAAYQQLGFEKGSLYSVATTPSKESEQDWVNKGDWLVLGEKVQAEKIFFVNEYPIVVFAKQSSSDPTAWIEHFNSIWCMARPQLLFLAREGELAVFNLTSPPARAGEDRTSSGRLLEVVNAVADIQVRLAHFRREQVESGKLFEEARFGMGDRADRALIRDLGHIRIALLEEDLSPSHAHALIGRSIFVRYLEDRGVLTEQYFRDVVKENPVRYRKEWNTILDTPCKGEITRKSKTIYYPRVLQNKLFTYALFRKLSKDFNGDIFPIDSEEQLVVSDKHLKLLQRFLLGGMDGGLFFFAYRFDVIPIELISSIYEKFYSLKPDKQRKDGSYYTPASLVDFLLAQTLTDECLAQSPQILDPACGSGIFLVESFRRIVRYLHKKTGKRLNSSDLRDILRKQIRGIDINREAIRVAAFSLYLAMLHYLEPPDILKNRLPSLTCTNQRQQDPENYLDILLVSDAFDIEANVDDEITLKRFSAGCADVVVGNPPWGTAKTEDELAHDSSSTWCKERGLSVGDQERSQSFIHRTMYFLTEQGRAGLLVSTGVFFKSHKNSREFRKQWLEATTLQNVVNFAAVRDTFFRSDDHKSSGSQGAIAPFAAVIFNNTPPAMDSCFRYWSAKETAFVAHVQAVVLNSADLRYGVQSRFIRDDTLWKIYWWGSHRDESLIHRLRNEITLQQQFDASNSNFRIGFIEGKKDLIASGWLLKYKEYPTSAFERYGPLPWERFKTPPKKVNRRREKEIYQGPRLLVKRGIGADGIVARFQEEDFCFRHSIYCIRVNADQVEEAKLALGIIWSSLTEYYMFMTSGTWGLWHDEILKQTYGSIPACTSGKKVTKDKVVKIVDQLRLLPPGELGPLFQNSTVSRESEIARLEDELDKAVFELFGLTFEEQQRVYEFCSLGLDLFYQGMQSKAVQPICWPKGARAFGNRVDIDTKTTGELTAYLQTFLDIWEPKLSSQKGRFRWHVIHPSNSSVTAIIFETESADSPIPPPSENDETAWKLLIDRLGKESRHVSFSKRVYIDGFIRIVSNTEIVIFKRNERRLWTVSTAFEDAEATMLMLMTPNAISAEVARD